MMSRLFRILLVIFCLLHFCSTHVCPDGAEDGMRQSVNFEAFDEELMLFQTHLVQTRSIGTGSVESEFNHTVGTQVSDTAAEAMNKTQQVVGSKPALEFRKPLVKSSEQLAESRKPPVESSKPAVELKQPLVDIKRPPAVETSKQLINLTASPLESRQHTHLAKGRNHFEDIQGAVPYMHSELLQDHIQQSLHRSGAEPLTEEQIALLYRPVSATVRDTIILSVLCLLIYSSLALIINIIELSDENEVEGDSELKKKMKRAAKELQVKLNEGVAIVKYVPLFACQFVAMRMYVLAVTNGEGEPPIWVKRTMDVTTGLLIARALAILFFPTKLMLHISGSDGQDKKLVSDEHAVDTEYKPFHESPYSLRFKFWVKASQVSLSVLSLVGNAGIIVGIWSFATWHRAPSPPVIVTVIVCCGCVLPYEMLMWTSPPLARSREEAIKLQRWRRAVRYGTRALRKAPMFGVLMLADRMRAMQINPPAGRQQTWAYVAMVGAAGALFIETMVCYYIGYNILEAINHRIEMFGARIARHVSAGIFFVCVAVTAGSVFVIPNTAQIEGTETLSTTLQTVIMLTAIYYAVHGSQWLVAVYMDFKDVQDPTVLDTLLATGISVNICPLLGILYVACRMRALQISGNLGAPQWWAQDAMHLSTFGVLIQVVLAVLMPIFTGSAPAVAPDGSPRHDKDPLFLAYLVICVKWVALFAIHGSAFTVILSIFVITPEQALADSSDETSPLIQFAQTFLVFTMVTTITLVVLSSRALGLLVKLAIESVDRDLLGVEIEIDKVLVSVWQGKLTIQNLVVKNPDNHDWRSPDMVSMKTCIVDVAWRPLICQGHIEIECLALQALEVNFERPLEHFSNVHFVLNKLKSGKKKSEHKKKPTKHHEAKQHEASKQKTKEKKKHLILHQLSFTEIAANLVSTRLGTMFSIVVPSVNFADYAKEKNKDMMSTEDMVMLVLEILLETIIHNLGCRALLHGAEHLEKAVCGAKKPPQQDEDEQAAGQPSQSSWFSRVKDPKSPALRRELTSGY